MSGFWFTSYRPCLETLHARLREPSPGRIQLLTGPRQVGKTTLMLELTDRLGTSAIYAACDGPEAGLPGFWERLWSRAAENNPAVVLLDEVQHLERWDTKLKAEWDRIRRRRLPIHVIATGSSALRVTTGSRESLAGRFERVVLTHWSARSVGEAFDVPLRDAPALLVRHGGYPGAMPLIDDPARWTAYVRDAIVEPAIGKDILATKQVRKPALLRQLFFAAVSAPAHVVTLQKLRGQLEGAGALETIAHYLNLLEDAYLVAVLPKHASRTVRQRASPPKLVALSNALLAATDPRGIPSPQADPERYGTWVENACIAFAWCAGQAVSYWREQPYEVDFIIDGTWGRWAVEVKTGGFTMRDLEGLLRFNRMYPAYRPLVLCPPNAAEPATRAGIDSMAWTDYLLDGPPAVHGAHVT